MSVGGEAPAPTLTDALLGTRLARDPAGPLVTYYDDSSGERIELSATTFANWAAKSANLLRDECDLEPGGRIAALLPAHWQTLAVLLGAWWCGAEVSADPAGADVVCCDADRLDTALDAGAGVVVALSLHAFGTGIPGLPPGVLDYAGEVRPHGDVFVPDGPVDGPVLDGADLESVLTIARAAAASADFGAGDRVLTTRDWSVGDGLVEVPLAVLTAGASLVQCRNADPDALDRRIATERVTRRV
ncbi:MAG: TIGR03089 family protein [Pseudonocardia sp.]